METHSIWFSNIADLPIFFHCEIACRKYVINNDIICEIIKLNWKIIHRMKGKLTFYAKRI